MEVIQLNSEGVAALEVVDEVGVGLVGFGFVRLGEVDEVGAVGEDVFPDRVGVEFGEVVEGRCGGWVQGRGSPFALGFEEDGEGVGADVEGVGDGVLDACCMYKLVSKKVQGGK